MEFKAIFADNYLHAVCFDSGKDELSLAFQNWFDIEYLMDFFESNITDLRSGFFGHQTVEKAVTQTLQDAKVLQNRIENISTLKGKKQEEAINDLFKPLDNRTAYDLRAKAKVKRPKSWLRIYAIKFDGVIVVTGSAIKLSHQMKEKEHTKKELQKLDKVKDFLREQGVSDADGFTSLIAEL